MRENRFALRQKCHMQHDKIGRHQKTDDANQSGLYGAAFGDDSTLLNAAATAGSGGRIGGKN